MTSLWKFFFFCGLKEDYDEIEDRLKKGLKTDALYVMCHEVADDVHHRFNGSHYHFFAQIEDKAYHSFAKWMKDRYTLIGKASDGNSREYGCVKSVKDQDRAIAYILKDGDYRSNMEPNLIKNLYETSFKKNKKDERDFIEQLFLHIKQSILVHNGRDPKQCQLNKKGEPIIDITPYQMDKKLICMAIIAFYQVNKDIGTLSRAVILRLFERFVIYGSGVDAERAYSILFELN